MQCSVTLSGTGLTGSSDNLMLLANSDNCGSTGTSPEFGYSYRRREPRNFNELQQGSSTAGSEGEYDLGYAMAGVPGSYHLCWAYNPGATANAEEFLFDVAESARACSYILTKQVQKTA